jgi:hypothetical protein
MAVHYGCGVIAARPYKPRDKAKVEVAVQIVQRWIVAALRDHKFYSVAEANQAIRELLDKLNQRPFKKRPGSRASLFAELDQPALQPLPAEPYDLSQWSHARVNIDYHVAFDGNFYSVPYTLVNQTVEVRLTLTTIEIFRQSKRVASHLQPRTTCSRDRGRASAQKSSGESGVAAFTHDRLGRKKPARKPLVCSSRFWRAIRIRRWDIALAWASSAWPKSTAPSAWKQPQRARSILEKGLDHQPLAETNPQPTPRHDNLRGAEYFQ